MGLFNIIKNKLNEKKQKKETDKILREEVEKEMTEEIIKMRKEKIRQEILAKERGEKKQSKGGEFLKKLGEEFKGSNIGGKEQMNNLIGKKTTTEGIQTNDKIMSMIGNKNNKDVTKKDIAGILGYNYNVRKDGVEVIGTNNTNEEKLRKFTNLGNNEEKLKKFLNKKLGDKDERRMY